MAVVEGVQADALREKVRGEVIAPGDGAYGEARRVWNGIIDRQPALVVRCTGNADVIATVAFAREHGLPVSVRGGGHNVAGTAVSEGGVVIDLSADAERRRGRREADGSRRRRSAARRRRPRDPGLRARDAVRRRLAHRHRGLTLHGGMGFLTRRLGLSCDNLIGADVVTADGRLVHTDAERHPELLWALRGGGGNFGAVTSLEYRLHDVGPDGVHGDHVLPGRGGSRGAAGFREIIANAPDELMAIALYWSAPAEEPFPPEWHGQPVFIAAGCWSGPPEDAEEAVKPLRELATPVADLSGPMPFLVAQSLFDPEYPDGRRYYWKSTFLSDVGTAEAELLGRYAASRPSPLSSIDVWALGGAMRNEPAGGSAFAKRDAPFLLGSRGQLGRPRRRRGEHHLGARADRARRASSLPAGRISTSPASSRRASSSCARPTARTTSGCRR